MIPTLLVYAGIVFGINEWLGSNSLFISGKPNTASMLDLLPPWPYYIPYMFLIGVVVILILYLPYVVKDWLARRNPQPPPEGRLSANRLSGIPCHSAGDFLKIVS